MEDCVLLDIVDGVLPKLELSVLNEREDGVGTSVAVENETTGDKDGNVGGRADDITDGVSGIDPYLSRDE
jgi:hypothetical protein